MKRLKIKVNGRGPGITKSPSDAAKLNVSFGSDPELVKLKEQNKELREMLNFTLCTIRDSISYENIKLLEDVVKAALKKTKGH